VEFSVSPALAVALTVPKFCTVLPTSDAMPVALARM
jgi:hypothetical protein